MNEAQHFFEAVVEQLLSVKKSTLKPARCTVEGYPALYINQQPFAVLYDNAMVFRLAEDQYRSAIALPGTHLWSLPNNPSLRQWVVVPLEYQKYWYSLAFAALQYARKPH